MTAHSSQTQPAGAPRNPDDLRLVQAALAGDPEARATFARRMGCVPSFVKSRHARIGRPLDSETLDDVVQNTLAAVWKKAATYAGDASLESWAYAFCALELRVTLSRRARRPVSVEPLDEDLADHHSTPTLHDDVHRALERLPTDARRIVELKHFQGLTFEEIGIALGISPNTAKTRHYRGLVTLRTLLAPSQERESER